MCEVTLGNQVPTAEIRMRLGTVRVLKGVLRRGRLGWFGSVERKAMDDWVKACRILWSLMVELEADQRRLG